MKRLFCLSFFLLGYAWASNSHAHFTEKGHVHTLSETQQVFWNSDCQSTDTCDLKRFTLTTSAYEVWFSDDPVSPTYANGVIIEYETDSVAALEKYAIVQFVKGCVFHGAKNAQGKITQDLSYVVSSFDESIPLCFPDWVIDSQDTDPAYNIDSEHGRFYLLRCNRPGSYDRQTQKYYGEEKPSVPVVYMTDHPAGAFVTKTGVKSAALEFNTCIYKARDVPKEARREYVKFAKPITCFPWQNVYVYDFDLAKFRTDLANIPRWWEEPPRVNIYLLAVLVTLFIALALLVFSHLGKFLIQKERLNSARSFRQRRLVGSTSGVDIARDWFASNTAERLTLDFRRERDP